MSHLHDDRMGMDSLANSSDQVSSAKFLVMRNVVAGLFTAVKA